jgi:single-strand DNA-binding protein
MANFNFNRVILGGRLTSDVELKTTPSGTFVTSFSVAINRRGAKEGQQQADFINVVAYKERAEFISNYFKKGSSICIEGEIQTRSWKDNSGNTRYSTEVIASQVHFVDSKSEGVQDAPSVIPGFKAEPKPEAPHFEEMSLDEDLPF